MTRSGCTEPEATAAMVNVSCIAGGAPLAATSCVCGGSGSVDWATAHIGHSHAIAMSGRVKYLIIVCTGMTMNLRFPALERRPMGI